MPKTPMVASAGPISKSRCNQGRRRIRSLVGPDFPSGLGSTRAVVVVIGWPSPPSVSSVRQQLRRTGGQLDAHLLAYGKRLLRPLMVLHPHDEGLDRKS